MKKIFLLLISYFIIFSSHAQFSKIAVKGSWNVSTARVYYVNDRTRSNIKQPVEFKNGYGFALLFKAQFDDVLHFSPTIGYNRRGYIYKPTYGDTLKYDNTIHYIDIIPALSADFPVGERKNTLVISGGPQLGFAISGTEKLTTISGTTTHKMKISSDGYYGLFDLGVSTGIGFHSPRMFVEAGYLIGLANINNRFQSDHRNIRNRMLSLSFGYYLK
ncbi:MAG: outer membrane beta-barrel protein [Bacteroidota bacterium]